MVEVDAETGKVEYAIDHRRDDDSPVYYFQRKGRK